GRHPRSGSRAATPAGALRDRDAGRRRLRGARGRGDPAPARVRRGRGGYHRGWRYLLRRAGGGAGARRRAGTGAARGQRGFGAGLHRGRRAVEHSCAGSGARVARCVRSRTPGRRDTHRVGRTRRTRRGIARGHGAWLSAAGAAFPGPHRCDERAAMARCLRPGPHSPTITAHMTSPYDIPQHDPADADHGPAPLRTEHKFSHVTTGRYLPTPGKAPAWPFADIGNWMIDANESAADWLVELRDWRREHLVARKSVV